MKNRIKLCIQNKINKMHYQKTLIRCIFVFLFFFVLFYNTTNTLAYKKGSSKYYTNLSDDEMDEIFELSITDVANPWIWINKDKTCVVIEQDEDTGNINYWWNTPNIQQSVLNSFYGNVIDSGYGGGSGELAKDNQKYLKLPERSEAKTALQKYGCNIPSPSYVGERPLITISINSVVLPDSIPNAIGRLVKLVFTGKVIGTPTNNDLNSLVYISPNDYETSNMSFENWVNKHWDQAMKNIKSNQVLLSAADQKTGQTPDGRVWVKDTIITHYGFDKKGDYTAKQICAKLKGLCGQYYSDVAKNIIAASKIQTSHQTTRIMPYDLRTLTAEDKSLFGGVVDHRSEMQYSLYNTGYDKTITNLFKKCFLLLSGRLTEITLAINSLANFTFLEKVGFDPLVLWDIGIAQILLTIMVIGLIFFCVKSAIKVVKGNGGSLHLIIKLLSSALLCAFIICIASVPEKTYDIIKEVSTTVFNLSNVVFQQVDGLSELYGNGDATEKEECEIWLPYFNNWTIYNTSNTLLSEAQKIDLDSGLPEVKKMKKVPKIDGVEQTLWSTILADNFTNNKKYSNKIYRVVDHFMAPRINNFDESDIKVSNLEGNITQNENYKGDLQTKINIAGIPFQILIFILVVFKVILFFEFIFNISILLFQLTLSVTNNYNLSKIIKELFASMLNVAIINIIAGLVIWTSLITTGIPSLLICLFYFFILVKSLKALMNSSTPFTPKVFKPLRRAKNKMDSLFSDI